MAIKPHEKRGARYRRISLEIYADDRVRALSPAPPSGHTLWMYLLVGPFTSLIPGVLVVGEAGMAERLRWPIEDFRRCLREITDSGMACVDWDGPLIFVPNALKHNLPQSPSVVKGWRQAWAEIPSCALKIEAARKIRSVLVKHGTAYARAFDMISGGAELSQTTPQFGSQTAPQTLSEIAAHQDQDQDQEDSPPSPPPAEVGRVRAVQDETSVVRLDRARRAHPLDEPPRLAPEAIRVFDEDLWPIWPQKDTGRVPAFRAWVRLNPTVDVARQIVAEVRSRLARGWARDADLQYLPRLPTFLDDRRWEMPFVPRTRPTRSTAADFPDGFRCTQPCPECRAPVDGQYKDGEKIYPPSCPACGASVIGGGAPHLETVSA